MLVRCLYSRFKCQVFLFLDNAYPVGFGFDVDEEGRDKGAMVEENGGG